MLVAGLKEKMMLLTLLAVLWHEVEDSLHG
jgi:hypothetical protein